MTKAEREAFYDAEVAPVLADLSRKCVDAGLSMLAVVEWGKHLDGGGDFGETAGFAKGTSETLRLFRVYVKAEANFDRFCIAFMRHVNSSGLPHSSVCLRSLGIDPDPEKRRK